MLATAGMAQAQYKSRAVISDYPFEITTDASKPVLYYIYSGRDGNGDASGFVFANEIPFKETANKLCIVYKNPNEVDPTQLWYFMEEEGGIKIISVADHRVIAVANTNDGGKCVWMKTEKELANNFYVWKLDKTNGYYAFKTSDDKTFLSHYGNWSSSGPQMGLYNADGSADDGSRVFFEALPKSDYTSVPNIYNNAVSERDEIYTICGRRIDKITAPGIYIRNGRKFIVRP